MFELRDFIHIATLLAAGGAMWAKLDSSAKEQTRQHAELKSALSSIATEVKAQGREASAHGARIDGVEERVDRCETRLDLMVRMG